jgi:hypothetical protein
MSTRPAAGSPPPGPARTSAARRHVISLRAAGGTYRSIGAAAGIAAMTVHGVAVGGSQPTAATVRAVLAVTPVLLEGRADAGGTRLRLRALHVMGHDCTRIARAVGTSPRIVRSVVRGDIATVSTSLRDAVITVYDAWWDKHPPARTPANKSAATRARRRAIAGNWCAAAALDDDELDTPGYRPAYGWKPARGTGTAPDLPALLRPPKEHNT